MLLMSNLKQMSADNICLNADSDCILVNISTYFRLPRLVMLSAQSIITTHKHCDLQWTATTYTKNNVLNTHRIYYHPYHTLYLWTCVQDPQWFNSNYKSTSGCSFTNGFCNISRIKVSSLLTRDFIKVK